MTEQDKTSQELTEEERGIIRRDSFIDQGAWASKSNILVMNYGSNPLVGYNFMLRVEGIYDLPCKSITIAPKENEYEYIQEGGLNDYVHMKRKPVSKPFTFKVERYVGIDYIDPIPNGAELILPVILLISRKQADFGRSLRTFVFTGCTVMGKEFGALDSEKSGLLTETTTIAYNEMLCVDNPLDFNGEGWKFDGTLEGSGTKHARYYSGEMRRAEKLTESKKRLWEFDGTNKEGKKKSQTKTTTDKNGKTVTTSVETPVVNRLQSGKPEVGKDERITETEKEKWTENGNVRYALKYEDYENLKKSKDERITETEKEKWTENGDVRYTLRYEDYEAKKVPKETLAKQAAKDQWRFQKKNKRGNRKQHAASAEQYGIKEPYATEMAKLAKEHLWQFDQDKKDGNGVRSANGYKEYGSKERSKEKMASLAEKNHWKFNKKNKKGMGRRNGNIDPNEQTKSQLAAKARLWPSVSSATQIVEYLKKNRP